MAAYAVQRYEQCGVFSTRDDPDLAGIAQPRLARQVVRIGRQHARLFALPLPPDLAVLVRV
jgi:hypothetical protein